MFGEDSVIGVMPYLSSMRRQLDLLELHEHVLPLIQEAYLVMNCLIDI